MIRDRSVITRLRADRSGVAMLEFAFALPIVLGLGLYGVETANFALINLKLSQITLALADNASRIGSPDGLSQQQLREVDLNDALQAARLQGSDIKLNANGRITISSLEESGGVQRIHWQRCTGLAQGATYASSYGRTTIKGGTPAAADDATAAYDPNAGINTGGANDDSASHPGSVITGGMGDVGTKVIAPPSSGVIFVEINYNYQPLVSKYFLGTTRMHTIASYIVRDRRIFTQVFNPAPAVTRSTCDLYTNVI